MLTCPHCGEPVTVLAGHGMVHIADCVALRRCRECSRSGSPEPAQAVCPRCGSTQVADVMCLELGRIKADQVRRQEDHNG